MPFPMETFEYMQGFFWILIRVSIMFFLLPLFGARNIPSLWKVGLSMTIALVLTPVVPSPINYPVTAPEIIVSILSEALMGLIIALTIRIFFTASQMGGQFLSFQMGFSMARAVDPQTGATSTVLTQFLYIFTILLFFTIDGHHMFIRVLARSFYLVPPNSITFNPSIGTELVKAGSSMFMLGIKIAAPIMVALFLSNLCLGIVARTVPQVNILMVGFPINLCIGILLFSFILMNIFPFVFDLKNKIGATLIKIITLM